MDNLKFPKSYLFCLFFYLFLLGLGVGAMICAGVFSAPAIFRASAIVEGLEISLFQSGVLMTSIFVKLNSLLLALGGIILAYELMSFFRHKTKISALLGIICVLLICLFAFYYTPFILDAQKLGENGIATLEFDKAHKESVLVFKGLLFALILLGVANMFKIIHLLQRYLKPQN
ncbi:DUF4149 domain-containing protein [Helicobacter burdigaliensis]|uniref:DUF4149 domain-containing protein n=1 Tax=Helicobacter burdigaliensis TaxID=2315334 RepID=UPI000EF6B72C|nr:DUF4149 domain-containing protein [Helicobacter burdigaliensis]